MAYRANGINAPVALRILYRIHTEIAPVTYVDLARDMGLSAATIRRQCTALEDFGVNIRWSRNLKRLEIKSWGIIDTMACLRQARVMWDSTDSATT